MSRARAGVLWGTAVLLAGLAGCRGATESVREEPSSAGDAAPAASTGQGDPRAALAPLPPAARARVPAGFRAELVTDALDGVRMMAFSPDGRLFATQPRAGRVVVVPIGGGEPYAWATGLNRPHGIAFHDGHLYVAETNAVARWPYEEGARRAAGRPERIATLPSGGGHWTRTLGFGPDSGMYVSVGSSCNACVEDDPRRAAILRFATDGSGREVYASGLRNAVGFAWDRQGRMWATDNGTDHLGDDVPTEEINLIREGAFYGWPFAWGNRVPDPNLGRRAPEKVRQTTPPAFAMQAHTAPLGIAFYEGAQFPAAYRGDAFVALHGSWNRSTPVGYKVIRVHFENGRPVRATDFLTGLGLGSGAWARPAGVVVGPDGGLFVSDDKGGHIFRVRYTSAH